MEKLCHKYQVTSNSLNVDVLGDISLSDRIRVSKLHILKKEIEGGDTENGSLSLQLSVLSAK